MSKRWGVWLVMCVVIWCGCLEPEEEATPDMMSQVGEDQGESGDMGHGEGDMPGEAVVWPSWTLEDIQPQSARFGERYGLDELVSEGEGRHVFVALLVGWCPYCRAQAIALEEIRQQAEFSGKIEFVVLHGESANNADDQKGMLFLEDGTTPRHGMITFQDVASVDAWGLHGGKKDDFFIYGPDGTLERHLPGGQETNLSTAKGRALVERALRDAIAE